MVKSNETPAFYWFYNSGHNKTLWLPLPLVPVPVLVNHFVKKILQPNDYAEMKKKTTLNC